MPVFIAVENQGSAFGDKKINTPYEGKPKKKPKEIEAKAKVYKARMEVAEAAEIDPSSRSDSTFTGILYEIRHEVSKRPGWKYGVAGSLRSIMKRIKAECDNGAGPFDTLAIYGHGNYGLMCVGLGNLDLEALNSLTKKGQKQVVEGLNMDGRMMNVQNSGTWGGLFDEYRACFTGDRSGTFHLFFLGCATGNISPTSFKMLTKVAAKTLRPILGVDVVAYGPERTVENPQLIWILSHMQTIKEDAKGTEGSMDIDKDPDAPLSWYKKT